MMTKPHEDDNETVTPRTGTDRTSDERTVAERVKAVFTPSAPPPPKETHHDPAKEIGVDLGASGSYAYLPVPPEWKRDRTVTIQNISAEHVGEDKDGVWLYRHM